MERERSAGAIIFRREGGNIYYLLLHYESGHWDFPKGHIEKDEKINETVLREIKEETGLGNMRLVPDFQEKIHYFFRRSYQEKTKTKKQLKNVVPLILKEVIFYLAETEKKDIKISFEHLGFEWLPFEEALERATYKNAKEILIKANQFLLGHDQK